MVDWSQEGTYRTFGKNKQQRFERNRDWKLRADLLETSFFEFYRSFLRNEAAEDLWRDGQER